ncbi:MAG: PIG-L deacetylase family protein [Terriglobia bacterium]
MATRRKFLRNLGAGAALSLPAVGAPAGASEGQQMPGSPPAGGVQGNERSSIMAIAAHPGDGFFAMGLPVALQVHHGGPGVFLSLSLGEKGSPTVPPSQYGAIQREASERAARVLGAKAAFLTYPDGEVPESDEAALAVCDLIREYKPAILVTHWRGSWHKDHRACYRVVNDAIFFAALPAITRKAPAHAVQKLYLAENWEDAEGFAPDTYLDVSPIFGRWSEACALFPMWRGETGFRYNDYYRSLAVARGAVSGFTDAVALMSAPQQLVRHVRGL